MKKAAYGPPFSFVRELSGFESVNHEVPAFEIAGPDEEALIQTVAKAAH
jgi:hypothetical protein